MEGLYLVIRASTSQDKAAVHWPLGKILNLLAINLPPPALTEHFVFSEAHLGQINRKLPLGDCCLLLLNSMFASLT